jgi:hypothetical protein
VSFFLVTQIREESFIYILVAVRDAHARQCTTHMHHRAGRCRRGARIHARNARKLTRQSRANVRASKRRTRAHGGSKRCGATVQTRRPSGHRQAQRRWSQGLGVWRGVTPNTPCIPQATAVSLRGEREQQRAVGGRPPARRGSRGRFPPSPAARGPSTGTRQSHATVPGELARGPPVRLARTTRLGVMIAL